MKGVVLAGGTGSRLKPLTAMFNKHLLPVGRFPMIHYAIAHLQKAGIHQILLVIGKQSANHYIDYFGSGEKFGVSLTYKIQDQPGGIAQGLALAEEFVQAGEKFVVLLGDNLFTAPLITYVKEFRSLPAQAMVLLKEVPDPQRYGVPHIAQQRIVTIEEKPAHPKSNFCVTGIYFYDSSVFEVIRSLRPSARGELEITDVNNWYAAHRTLAYRILSGWWTDAGTFQSLLEANQKFAGGDV